MKNFKRSFNLLNEKFKIRKCPKPLQLFPLNVFVRHLTRPKEEVGERNTVNVLNSSWLVTVREGSHLSSFSLSERCSARYGWCRAYYTRDKSDAGPDDHPPLWKWRQKHTRAARTTDALTPSRMIQEWKTKGLKMSSTEDQVTV